jgi:hypothetical protein
MVDHKGTWRRSLRSSQTVNGFRWWEFWRYVACSQAYATSMDPPRIAEFNRMREQIKLEKAREVKSLSELWRRYRRRVLVSVAVQTCTSLSGVNVIGVSHSSYRLWSLVLNISTGYYQTILYTGVGITGKTILLLSGAYGTLGREYATHYKFWLTPDTCLWIPIAIANLISLWKVDSWWEE